MGTGYRSEKNFWVPMGTGYRPEKKFWVPMGTGYRPEKKIWVPMSTGYRQEKKIGYRWVSGTGKIFTYADPWPEDQPHQTYQMSAAASAMKLYGAGS